MLQEAALSDEMWDSGNSSVNLVQMRAIDTLAALGEGAGLVQGIMKWGSHVSPYIGELREGRPPIPDEDLKPAIELLDQPEHPQFTNAITAIGQSGRVDFQKRIETRIASGWTGAWRATRRRACLPRRDLPGCSERAS